MTDLQQQAFAEAVNLPESEQNLLAQRLLEELESERS
jgi:hypothetical protein